MNLWSDPREPWTEVHTIGYTPNRALPHECYNPVNLSNSIHFQTLTQNDILMRTTWLRLADSISRCWRIFPYIFCPLPHHHHWSWSFVPCAVLHLHQEAILSQGGNLWEFDGVEATVSQASLTSHLDIVTRYVKNYVHLENGPLFLQGLS